MRGCASVQYIIRTFSYYMLEGFFLSNQISNQFRDCTSPHMAFRFSALPRETRLSGQNGGLVNYRWRYVFMISTTITVVL